MGPGRAVVALAVVGMLAAACAAGEDPGADPGSDPPATSTSGSTPSAAPTTEPAVAAPTSPAASPTARPEAFAVDSLVVGDQHTCALDDVGAAWCWGVGTEGQLGDGSFEDRDRPTAVDTDVRFSTLAAGRTATCGIATAASGGGTWCWGGNAFGQLGDATFGDGGSDADRPTPAPIGADLALVELVAGNQHVCGLDAAGALWCWGWHPSGQLGVERSEPALTPVRGAEGLTFISLAPGGDTHGCGIDGERRAWCWGSDNFGQLGRGDTSNAGRGTPAAVQGDVTFAALANGAAHTCGIDTEAVVWCWGRNSAGQLGDGTTEDRLVPTPVAADLRLVSITAGDEHTCGVATDGTAWCWGSGRMGRLGGGGPASSVPVPGGVEGGHRWRSLHAGEEHTCGVDAEGGAWCWGSNRVGWLGSGTDETAVPVPVLPPGG